MFDFEPDDEPKWVDASMGKLYDYFDYYPELGIWPQQIKELEVCACVCVYAPRIFPFKIGSHPCRDWKGGKGACHSRMALHATFAYPC
eukprot:771091-Pelagomonas_calceolata.AAC.2